MLYGPSMLLLVLTVINLIIAVHSELDGETVLSDRFMKASLYLLLTAMITLTIAMK